jgi:signal transduction histidine kinase
LSYSRIDAAVIRPATAVVFAVYLIALAAAAPFLLGGGKVRRVRGWNYSAPGRPGAVTAVEPEGPAAGVLSVGDRILSINGDGAYSGFFRPDNQVYNYPPGTKYQVRFLHQGEVREAELQITSRPEPSHFPLIAAFLFGSLTFTGIGLLMGWQRPESSTARLGWIACQLTGFIYIGLAFQAAAPGWKQPVEADILLSVEPWHMWFAYWFLEQFPFGAQVENLWKRIRYFLAAFCALEWSSYAWARAVNALANRNPHFFALLPSWRDAAGAIFQATALFSLGIAAIAVVARNYRAAQDPSVRRRIEIVAGATLFGFFGTALASGLRLPYGQVWGNLAPLPIPICFAYGVLRHRVLDLRLAVRRGLRRLLAKQFLRALTLIPLAAIAARMLRNPSVPAGATGNVAWIALVILATLALAFRNRVLARFDRWFFSETLDREKQVRALLFEIAGFDAWEEASAAASKRLAFLFGAESVAIHLEEAVCPADAALRLPVTGPAGRDYGFLSMGPKKSEEAYGPAERELIGIVAAQLGLVRENLLLAAARLDAVTSERTRIAREMHDTVGQGFAGISLYLEAARKSLPPSAGQAREFLEEARALASRSLQEARESVAALRAASGSNLDLRLRMLARPAQAGPPEIAVDLQEGVCALASADAQWHLARIAEEAVTNACKHAAATQINVALRAEGERLVLRVRDDGGGFDARSINARGYGIVGMRERLGELRGILDIVSAPGKGAEIRAEVPFAPAMAAAGGAH